MDQLFDIPDSTDWLSTPLASLARVDSALRCQVCKDFFEHPVITSCSHTFCSLCIRRCLSVEGKCPACRSGDQELKLRRNWAVQELVDSFKLARKGVLEFARTARVRGAEDEGEGEVEEGSADVELHVAKKRRVNGAEKGRRDVVEGRRTRSQSRMVENSINTQENRQEVVIDDSQDEDYEPDDGLVACPICSRRMKNEAVFRHLDLCTGSQSLRRPQISSPRKPPPSSTRKFERLPAINFSILKENVLRKKLRDLGIPDSGSKHLLKRRYTEWMNLWNANCDAKEPKSKSELVRELDIWERTQGSLAPPQGSATGGVSVMEKDFDGSAWSATHGDNYKALIANARRKSQRRASGEKPQAPPAEENGLLDGDTKGPIEGTEPLAVTSSQQDNRDADVAKEERYEDMSNKPAQEMAHVGVDRQIVEDAVA
ncbi:DNA repair protein rad18 [Polytolypa hystricis UAMH7299]|uniref:Postreplication repair E3 ubiquitin-protein ligase RAD18 n=1 Tax=Polytolypa hystricis (strain UAMH7299) TaxID=1447883 RepID=A0A2B7YQY0_POLH7|nr:DNA repair protein rad18 [Polytolypa hystricis UAMH7299]